MGNEFSRQLKVHRFLGQALCYSSATNPRNLEHYTYTFWTADLAALIANGNLKRSLIAPQYPIYVSPKTAAADPDTSTQTAADGEAQGVYVDVAIAVPIIQPRSAKELGQNTRSVKDKTNILNFLTNFLFANPDASPRSIRVVGLLASLLAELKPGPNRHPLHLAQFYRNLSALLSSATLQCEAQALCLFSSAQYATQEEVLVIAAAGEYYQIRRLTRASMSGPGVKPFSSDTLKELKAAAKGRVLFGRDEDEDDDDDWTEGCEDEMYGDPNTAEVRRGRLEQQRLHFQQELSRKRKAAQDTQRTERLRRRNEAKDGLLELQQTKPNFEDRSAPIFTSDALNRIHRVKSPKSDFFESNPPGFFFDGVPLENWSGVLQLGSRRSNEYMASIQKYLREFEEMNCK